MNIFGGTIILPTLEGEIFRSFSPVKTGNAFTNYLQISDFSRLLYCKIKHVGCKIFGKSKSTREEITPIILPLRHSEITIIF